MTQASLDFSNFITSSKDGENSLNLRVDGIQCISCVQKIESNLNKEKDVNARVNLSTKKLNIIWKGEKFLGNKLAEMVDELGYKVTPFDKGKSEDNDNNEIKFLLRCLAVAAFATANLMIITDALWFSTRAEMGSHTRDLLNWLAAAISIPVIIYSGRPFFYNAWRALKNFHTNMDVPISLAIILAAVVSVSEMLRHAEHVYFDSSVMLIFFLLIGRYLDRKMRSKAKSAAEDLLAIVSGTATVIKDGKLFTVPVSDLKTGMVLQVAAGEKISADGFILTGESEIDTSLITGETMPKHLKKGDKIFAGMINIGDSITVEVTGAAENSMISEIVKLLEKAEQSDSKYVRIADKVAGYYTPVVHILALGTFIGWMIYGAIWQEALLIATTVLIITCPCAMGLAVPIVQVLASRKLFKKGMLLKSSDALEKLAKVDTIIFDKTGTLTIGKPSLHNKSEIDINVLKFAASMASKSKHPLSVAIDEEYDGDIISLEVQELKGQGLISNYNGREIKLGRRSFCGDESAVKDDKLEIWFKDGSNEPVRFTFSDRLRPDAIETIAKLKVAGKKIYLLSGDRKEVVISVSKELNIENYHAEMTPIEKSDFIKNLNVNTLMVGDGLNDAVALKTANVSMSPSSAIDITQNSADLVFRGESLSPVMEAINISRNAARLVRQNFALSILYNVVAVPFAISGYITPLIAAIAMSSSSIIVVLNSLRLRAK